MPLAPLQMLFVTLLLAPLIVVALMLSLLLVAGLAMLVA